MSVKFPSYYHIFFILKNKCPFIYHPLGKVYDPFHQWVFLWFKVSLFNIYIILIDKSDEVEFANCFGYFNFEYSLRLRQNNTQIARNTLTNLGFLTYFSACALLKLCYSRLLYWLIIQSRIKSVCPMVWQVRVGSITFMKYEYLIFFILF